MRGGLYQQMQDVKANKEMYSNLTLEMLTDYCLELANTDKRKFIIDSGKGGVIEYHKALYKYLNKSDEEILELVEILNNTLEEGIYRIDEDGVAYLGKV